MATKKSEEYELDRSGATPVKNSGRSRSVNKGDGILEPFVVDVKEYGSTFSLSKTVWAKISTDASWTNRKPALKIVLGNDEPKLRMWVVGDLMFQEMLDAWKEKNAQADD